MRENFFNQPLWREFDILTILPGCVYEGRIAGTCDAKSSSVKHTQLIRLMQFLMDLNDVYEPIRSTILSKDPLLNVKDAFYVVSREESRRGLHPGGSITNKSQPATFVVKTNNNTNNFNRRVNTNNNNISNRGPNPNLLCKNYGLIGHTMDRCYELIGYPAGFKRNLNLSKQSGNNNNKRFNRNSEVNHSVPSTFGSLSSSFTNEQMMKLLNLINENPPICKYVSLMLSVCHLNGTLTKIIAIGNLRLTSGIVLFDNLVVPKYNFGIASQKSIDGSTPVMYSLVTGVLYAVERSAYLSCFARGGNYTLSLIVQDVDVILS
ncbi:hypothetical protein Tco_1532688 [Tanacetum coccineum]